MKKDWDWDDHDRDNGYSRSDDNEGQWVDYDSHEGYASGMNDREFKNTLLANDKEWL